MTHNGFAHALRLGFIRTPGLQEFKCQEAAVCLEGHERRFEVARRGANVVEQAREVERFQER